MAHILHIQIWVFRLLRNMLICQYALHELEPLRLKKVPLLPVTWQTLKKYSNLPTLNFLYRKTPLKSLNIHKWNIIPVLFLVLLLCQLLRFLGIYWCIFYMRVSLFFLVFSFVSLQPIDGWMVQVGVFLYNQK